MPIFIDEKVCRLQVSVDYVFAPQVRENLHNLSNVELLDFEGLQASLSQHLTHVSIHSVVKYKVKIPFLLKSPMHCHYSWMIELFQSNILISHLLYYIILKQKKQWITCLAFGPKIARVDIRFLPKENPYSKWFYLPIDYSAVWLHRYNIIFWQLYSQTLWTLWYGNGKLCKLYQKLPRQLAWVCENQKSVGTFVLARLEGLSLKSMKHDYYVRFCEEEPLALVSMELCWGCHWG